jgi:hypothetical protein
MFHEGNQYGFNYYRFHWMDRGDNFCCGAGTPKKDGGALQGLIILYTLPIPFEV